MPGRVDRLLTFVVAAVGLGALASVALVEAVHIADKFQVTHVSGAWMALAKYANAGTLYPPLYDGHAYGGTRYMPLEILINAGAAHATGEYLVSAKLVAYGLLAALLALLYVLLRRDFELPTPLAAAAVATVAVANALSFSASSIGADTLAATLQLLAVTLASRSHTRRAAIAAALLCALAFFSKVSAVWAPAAIVLWLARRDRRLLLWFASALLIQLALGLTAFQLATGGRFFANVFGLGAGTLLPLQQAVHDVPRKCFIFLRDSGLAITLVFPFALFGVIVASLRRRLSLYHLSLIGSFLILLFVLTDRGTAYNQFIDVEVLSVVVAADLIRGTSRRTVQLFSLRGAFGIALTLGIGMGLAANIQTEVEGALNEAAGRPHPTYPTNPVGAYVSRKDRLLSQDPYIPVSLGELPVVLDAYMFRRIALEHPLWADQLVRRLDAREFDKVVMFRHVGADGALDPSDPYWTTNHFGPSVVAAIVRNYRPFREIHGYWIYVRHG
jgi:hypothetical protein